MHKGIINRKTQSYASSPNYLSDFFKSYQSSPLLKDSPRVEKLVKNTLKRFESEKADLEKIKEVALSFKESRQKKLKSYNLQTRIGNKVKSKVKRPNTVWVSPEPKDFSLDSPKPKYRHPMSSVERRANIGLEYFHLKSPRNQSPKDVVEVKIQKCVEENKKKEIEEYIRKKKKERIEKVREKKRIQQENELKRVKLLVKVEKKAKNALKKTKKNKKKKKIIPKIAPQSFEYPENKIKKSVFHSEDEEVFRIIHKKNPEKDDSYQHQNQIYKLQGTHFSQANDSSPLYSKLNVKLKSKKKSTDTNSKMPIIELLSVSHPSSHNSSSSDFSEQKHFIQEKIKNIKYRLNSMKDPKSYPITTLLKAQNALKTVIFKSISDKFFLIKYFNDYTFNKLSRESSEDMEKIWDKIEAFRSTEFLQDNDSISSLVPIEDALRTSKQNSKRPSEEIIEFFKKGGSGKSSLNICEVSQESSFDSIFSLEEDEKIVFKKRSYWVKEVEDQLEPEKPEFPKLEKEIEIFIDDASGSVKECLVYNKDSEERSFILTPEAEEVEEFNCADFLSKIKENKEQNDAKKEFETLDYNEIFDIILNEIFIEYLNEAVKAEYTKINFQLIGNNKCIVYDICVRTGVTAVLKFVEKLWAELDPIVISQKIADKSLHLNILSSFRQELKDFYQGIIEQKTLNTLEKKINNNQEVNEAVHIHNKAIFDTINEILLKISREVNPEPWKTGEFNVKGFELDKVFREVNLEVRRYCTVNAGRIANVSFINAEGVVDSELLQRVRENGLTSLLTAEIEQIEKEWVDYEAEEHQTVDELRVFLLDELIFEVAEILLFKSY